MLGKKGGLRWLWLVLGVLLILLLVSGMFLYNALVGPDYSAKYSELKNPASGLSVEEAIKVFDESFVYYLLASIEAYNLHPPTLSNDLPKIEFYIGDDIYNAIVDKGNIIVDRGLIDERDVVIRTTTEEAVKMVQDYKYTQDSFVSGRSAIELKAEKATLFNKGYLKMYEKLTGESITGSVVSIYTD
tara:strand:- start:4164 stop:4724 length:561 start_codon:yes stop_codon:yes gene_type:complete